MNPQDPKYQEKLKAISSAEPNYLSQFEMRYPVPKNPIKLNDHPRVGTKVNSLFWQIYNCHPLVSLETYFLILSEIGKNRFFSPQPNLVHFCDTKRNFEVCFDHE